LSLSPFLFKKRTLTVATEETAKEKEMKGDDKGTCIIRKFSF
jgi:hypothetical protein